MSVVTLVFLIFVLVWSVVTAIFVRRTFGHRIKRWWRGSIVNRNLPPHQRWPEILHWQVGDDFDFCSAISVSEPAGRFMAVTEDGYAYFDRYGDKFCLPISLALGRNQSLRNRRIDHSVKSTTEYMDLIKEFNIAYAELQKRDKRNGIAA